MTPEERRAGYTLLGDIGRASDNGKKWVRIYIKKFYEHIFDEPIAFDVRLDFFVYHYPKEAEDNFDEQEPAYECTPRGVEFGDYNNEVRISGFNIVKFEVLPDDAEPMYPPWVIARTQEKNLLNGEMQPLEPEPETWK